MPDFYFASCPRNYIESRSLLAAQGWIRLLAALQNRGNFPKHLNTQSAALNRNLFLLNFQRAKYTLETDIGKQAKT